MAPRDQSPRASDHRRPYSDRRDHNPRDTRDTRDSRPRRDRSNSRDRAPHSSRGGGGRGGNAYRGSDRDNRQNRSRSPNRSSYNANNNNNTRQRSSPRAPRGAPNTRDRKPVKAEEPPAQVIDPNEDEETAMKRVMGFVGFRSTKNTKVPGNDKLYGVRKDKKTEYRQYMNRVGGFNRPLSPTRL
ncbi:hypothetical protein D6D25_02440 [Aureobasidium pullulans]|nr:hypothetical protein D6D25_02440 [Aureobasidium pullulans]